VPDDDTTQLIQEILTELQALREEHAHLQALREEHAHQAKELLQIKATVYRIEQNQQMRR
jgi:hypothetical protein